jgi:MraZ protein
MLDIMPVMGEYRHNIDSKNRLFIPAKHREALGSPLVVYPNIRHKTLKICSVDEWRSITEKMTALPVAQREPLMRFFNRMGDTFEPDAQGRVTLNQSLVDYAGLRGSVYIIGCGQNAEIWSEEEYGSMSNGLVTEELLAAAEDADV